VSAAGASFCKKFFGTSDAVWRSLGRIEDNSAINERGLHAKRQPFFKEYSRANARLRAHRAMVGLSAAIPLERLRASDTTTGVALYFRQLLRLRTSP